MPTDPQSNSGLFQEYSRRRQGSRTRRASGFTLVEVVIALFIITLFSASAISLTLFNERRTLNNFYRLEAYRLAQSMAEHAMQVQFPTEFTPTYLKATNDPASATRWVWTNTERAMLRSSAVDKIRTPFTYPAYAGGVTFTKNITAGTDIGTAKVLNMVVTWSFVGRNYSISVPVVRGGN